MSKQKKRISNQRNRRNARKRRFGLKNSVILMLVLLCIFFATRTDAWLGENIQDVMEYVAIPGDNPLADGLQTILERLGSGSSTPVHTEGEMEVHFLDVGQGSACLVESEGQYMLIDGGDRDASSFVVAYLRDQGVEKLEYIIASHYDSDHISGLVGVLNVYPTEKILCPDYEADTKIYASLIQKIEENGCEVIHPRAGGQYELGEAVFTIVAPVDSYEDDNNRSIGIRLVHGSNSFLMLGDAEKESEEDICRSGEELRSDVYLVSHHGSSSSTTDELLSRVRPSAAVISVGKDNSYGHPHSQTMERLEASGVQLYRTDIQGTLTATSDGEKLEWSQEPCMDFTPGDRQ